MAECVELEDSLAGEVVVSTAIHKQHDINAPGTSKVLSVAEFREQCAAAAAALAGCSQLKTKDPETLDATLSEQMGITTAALKEIRRACE
jgi:hypothetical protein